MKVYLWKHRDGIFLLNEDFTKFCRPYFITHPQRTLLLKARYNGDKVDLLSSVTNEELQELVNNALLKWKPVLPYAMVDEFEELIGFEENYIAVAEVTL